MFCVPTIFVSLASLPTYYTHACHYRHTDIVCDTVSIYTMYLNRVPGNMQSLPDLKQAAIVSDENTPHDSSPSSIKRFHEKNATTSQSKNNSLNGAAPSIRSRTNVLPATDSKTSALDFKMLVPHMLKKDIHTSRNNGSILSLTSPLENIGLSVHDETIPDENNGNEIGIEAKGIIKKDGGVEDDKEFNEEEIFGGKLDRDEESGNVNLVSDKGLMELSLLQDISLPSLGLYSTEFFRDTISTLGHLETLSIDEDPRTCYLQPYQAYADVEPLMLGQPLAPFGTPLDLSSVEKRPMAAGPFYEDNYQNYEEKKDELKLYSLLEYEFNQIEKRSYSDGLPNGSVEDPVREVDEPSQGFGLFRSIFNKIFRHNPSEEEIYMKEHPWYRILNRIDNPDVVDGESAHGSKGSPQFERNNIEMIPMSFVPRVDDGDKHTVDYVSLRR